MSWIAHYHGYDEPLEYESDNLVQCADCRAQLDADDDEYLAMDDGNILCPGCRKMCAGNRSEWLTDLKGAIQLRCRATGRLESWCVGCAAEEWLERLVEFADEEGYGDGWPTTKDLDKHSISVLYAYYLIRGKAHQEFMEVAR